MIFDSILVEILGILGLGFIIGIKHAFEPDHVIAVSTIVQKEKSIRKAFAVGMIWGLGHTTTLFIAGMLLLTLKIAIPEQVALSMELVVGLMIFLLGIAVLKELFFEKTHFHVHTHNGVSHMHYHSHKKSKSHSTHYHKPFIIGLVHGIAGSAALMLLVLSTIDSIPIGLLYIMIFGIGSVGGMGIVSGFLGLPFKLTDKRSNDWNYTIRYFTGCTSIIFGLFLIIQIGFVQGLLI